MTHNGAGGVLVTGAFQAVGQRWWSSCRPLKRFLRARALNGQKRRQQRNLTAPPRHESRRHADDHRQTETNHNNQNVPKIQTTHRYIIHYFLTRENTIVSKRSASFINKNAAILDRCSSHCHAVSPKAARRGSSVNVKPANVSKCELINHVASERTRYPENSKRPRRHGHSARRSEHSIYHARAKKPNDTKRTDEVKVARCSKRFAFPLADSRVAVVDAGAPSHPVPLSSRPPMKPPFTRSREVTAR